MHQIEDHYDSPLALLDDNAQVRLVTADENGVPIASSAVVNVEWQPYGMRDRALWLELVDGRKLGVMWRRPETGLPPVSL